MIMAKKFTYFSITVTWMLIKIAISDDESSIVDKLGVFIAFLEI